MCADTAVPGSSARSLLDPGPSHGFSSRVQTKDVALESCLSKQKWATSGRWWLLEQGQRYAYVPHSTG